MIKKDKMIKIENGIFAQDFRGYWNKATMIKHVDFKTNKSLYYWVEVKTYQDEIVISKEVSSRKEALKLIKMFL